jgi:putative endonuclease
MIKKSYYVYLMTNKTNTVIYTGITNNLLRRIYEHKHKLVGSFTAKYKITKLVYYETFYTPMEAIDREKQIKAGPRKKKEELIKSLNPEYEDLYLKFI